MKKTLIFLCAHLFSILIYAQDPGEGIFTATITNDQDNPTQVFFDPGCSQVRVQINIDPTGVPWHLGTAKSIVSFDVNFYLTDVNHLLPDVLVSHKLFDMIEGINYNGTGYDPNLTDQDWNGDLPLKHAFNIAPGTVPAGNYYLTAQLNAVFQSTSPLKSGDYACDFTLSGNNVESGLPESCFLDNALFPLAGGFINNINCQLHNLFEIQVLSPTMALTPIINQQAVCASNTTILTATASGGVSPYSFLWSNGSVDPGIVEPDGAYSVTVTDAAGCSASVSSTVQNFPASYFDYPNGIDILQQNFVPQEINADGDGIIRIRGPVVINEGIRVSWNNLKLQFSQDQIAPTPNDLLPHSGIVIKSFGKLTLNGCTLSGTDNCALMWDGIQARGQEVNVLQVNESGTVFFPGELEMNNSEIRDAVVGVALYSLNVPPVTSGNQLIVVRGNGKITATGSRFVNNRVGVAFRALYENKSASKIINCSFSNDALMKDQGRYPGLGTSVHISIIGIDDIQNIIEIKANTFSGLLSLPEGQRGIGIYSNSSSALITSSKIGLTLNPNTFRDLTKGIDAYSSGSLTNILRIKDNRFVNVQQGLTANGTHFDEISFNSFDVPAGSAALNTWGMNLYGSAGYLATENTLSSLGTNAYTYGVLARNNELATSQLYKNTFAGDFYAATQAEQQNTQLQIKCNTYSGNNAYDWAVTSGVLADQGFCSGADKTTPAGNEFASCSVTDESQIFLDPLVPGFKYNSHTNYLPNCFSNAINVIPCGAAKDITSCPTFVDPPAIKKPKGDLNTAEWRRWRVSEIRRLQNEGRLSELLTFVSNNQVPENVYLHLPTLLAEGRCAEARLRLADVSLSLPEGQAFFRLYSVLTSLCEQGRGHGEMTPAERQTLEDVANGSTWVAVHAQSVLAENGGQAYLRVAERIGRGAQNKAAHQPSLLPAALPEQLVLYPNPAAGSVRIELQGGLAGQLSITDALGREVLTKKLQANEGMAVTLSAGLYMVCLLSPEGEKTQKQLLVTE